MPENYTGRKQQLEVSLERLKKKNIELCGRLVTKKNLTRPVRRKQIYIFFGLISKLYKLLLGFKTAINAFLDPCSLVKKATSKLNRRGANMEVSEINLLEESIFTSSSTRRGQISAKLLIDRL